MACCSCHYLAVIDVGSGMRAIFWRERIRVAVAVKAAGRRTGGCRRLCGEELVLLQGQQVCASMYLLGL
jgi:hypothetical protein